VLFGEQFCCFHVGSPARALSKLQASALTP
jgi:hypothetical protein